MRDMDLLIIGEICADLILSGDVTPKFGQVEKLVDDAILTTGSSAAICASGAGRLGLNTGFIGVAGDDEFGRFMQSKLKERGVDTNGIIVNPNIKTGLSVILSRGNDRAILTFSGSISALRYEDIPIEFLSRARHLHVASYFLLDSLRPDIPKLFKTAKSMGLSISLDTNYDPTECWGGNLREVLTQVDVFLPNETELKAITGIDDTQKALDFMARDIPTVIVKRGSQGALARQGTTQVAIPSLKVDVIDTTGAGDSFDAGFLYGYLHNWNLEKSVQLACICGSLSTRMVGGTPSQATLDEALTFMELQ